MRLSRWRTIIVAQAKKTFGETIRFGIRMPGACDSAPRHDWADPASWCQRPGALVTARARFDYTTVGHVTIDVLADGSRRPGGTAFYSALQASRLGLRALILTRGAVPEIERLLEPYRT